MNEPQVTIIANVVAKPELRISNNGKPWVSVRLASTPRVKDRNTQEWVDGETLWLSATAYDSHAENIAASLDKGMRVIVQGRLSSNTYTDNLGQQRTGLQLQIDEIGTGLRFGQTSYTPNANRNGSSRPANTQTMGAWGNTPPQTQNPVTQQATQANQEQQWTQQQAAQPQINPWGEHTPDQPLDPTPF